MFPVVVYVIALTQFAMPFMYSGVALTLPAVGLELAASGVSLALIETVYLGAGAAFLLPLGRVAENADRHTLFKAGLLVYAISTLAIGFLPSMNAIIAVRFIQGVASAFMGATAMAILYENCSASTRGRAIGLCLGAVYVGLAAGPLFAGIITTYLGWRWVYFLTALPLFVSFFVVQVSLSGWRFSKPELNWRASFCVVTAVFLMIFGCALLASGSTGYLLIALGIAACAAFFALDKRSVRPMLQLARIRENRDYGGALLGLFVIYAAGAAMIFLLSIYLQLLNGFSPQQAGFILMISPIAMAVVAPISGRLADTLSPKVLAAPGALFVMGSLLLATEITIETELPMILAVLITQGIGFGLFSSPNMSLILRSVGQDQLSMASALSAKMRSLGMVVSMAIVTVFLAVFMGSGPIGAGGDYVHGMMFGYLSVLEYSFVVHAVLACCAALLVVGRSWSRAK
ncbi:MAG: MFS transporter [Candidatus Rariloculaceae bacterium]